MKRDEHFWNIDLIELFRDWLSQVGVVLLTALGFFAMAIPVLIASFILWWLAGFPSINF